MAIKTYLEQPKQNSKTYHLLPGGDKSCTLIVQSTFEHSAIEQNLTIVVIPKPTVMNENINLGPSILTRMVEGSWNDTLATVYTRMEVDYHITQLVARPSLLDWTHISISLPQPEILKDTRNTGTRNDAAVNLPISTDHSFQIKPSQGQADLSSKFKLHSTPAIVQRRQSIFLTSLRSILALSTQGSWTSTSPSSLSSTG